MHDALPGALLSTVNLAEVLARIARVGADPRPVPGYLASLGVETVPFDEPLARMASRISGATRRTGLSLGDCACLATAALEERPALTADRAWKSVKVGVDIRLVR